MQCERAQEYFSDYLERTLDRPMTVALEAHVAGCAACREEIAALRDTFFALEALPAVEPPPDGAWQVLCRMQTARAEELEAARRRPAGFLTWLRGLSAGTAAMTAGLATLVVAGSLMLAGVPEHVRLGFGRGVSPAAAVSTSESPVVSVTYGSEVGGMQEVNLRVAPSMDLPDARVVIAGSQTWEWPAGRLNRGTITEFPIRLATAARGEVLRVTVESALLGRRYDTLVAVPLGPRSDRTVTLVLSGQTMEQALRQLAPSLGMPVVVDGDLQTTLDLGVDGQPARRCLEQLAGQLGSTVREDGGVLRVGR